MFRDAIPIFIQTMMLFKLAGSIGDVGKFARLVLLPAWAASSGVPRVPGLLLLRHVQPVPLAAGIQRRWIFHPGSRMLSSVSFVFQYPKGTRSL